MAISSRSWSRIGPGAFLAGLATAFCVAAMLGAGSDDPAIPHPDAIDPVMLACAGLDAQSARAALSSDAVFAAVAEKRAAEAAMETANADLRADRERVWREGGEYAQSVIDQRDLAAQQLASKEAALDQAIANAIYGVASPAGLILAQRVRVNDSRGIPPEYAVLELSEDAFRLLAQAHRMRELGRELEGVHEDIMTTAETSPNVLLVRQRLELLRGELQELWGDACVAHGLVDDPEGT